MRTIEVVPESLSSTIEICVDSIGERQQISNSPYVLQELMQDQRLEVSGDSRNLTSEITTLQDTLREFN